MHKIKKKRIVPRGAEKVIPHVTLLERLRLETRPAHDRIEQAIDIGGRIRTVETYRAILERFYGFHAVWEPLAESYIADRTFFHPRRKIGLLEQDLRVLGHASESIRNLPRCHPALPLQCSASAFGSMYVIEGSTLGGAVIAKLVRTSLGFTRDHGCAYFASYGSATGQMWSQFREKLLAQSSAGSDEIIVSSASRTFDVMHDWLSEGQAR